MIIYRLTGVFLLIILNFSTSFHSLKKSNPRFIKVSQLFQEKGKADMKPKEYPSLKMTPALKLGGAFLVGLASATIFWNTGRLYETADSIPKQYFKEQQTITGEVVKITDGDTFRMRHIPGFWANSDFKGILNTCVCINAHLYAYMYMKMNIYISISNYV
jgi:hypothetical protein